MAKHAAVSFLVNAEPWSIEDELIAIGSALPLNVKGSDHPFSQVLSGLRSSKIRGSDRLATDYCGETHHGSRNIL